MAEDEDGFIALDPQPDPVLGAQRIMGFAKVRGPVRPRRPWESRAGRPEPDPSRTLRRGAGAQAPSPVCAGFHPEA